MKGSLHTDELMGAVVSSATGLRTGRRISHVFVMSVPTYHKPLIITDGAINIAPTLEDGFGMVLAQAEASALPILTTTNGGGPDLVREGETGWVLPTRSPEAFMERLRWCDEHREELAAMIRHLYSHYQSRDWSDVASDFERNLRTASRADRALQRRRVEEITNDLPPLPDFSEFDAAFRPHSGGTFGDMRTAFYAGYDEAAHSGPGRYGVREGEGGVFGTTGGGTFRGGMHEVERPVIETEKGEDE